jgi:hypothetical protein
LTSVFLRFAHSIPKIIQCVGLFSHNHQRGHGESIALVGS